MRDDELRWFTSSFSGGNGDNCVEVAFLPGAVARARHQGPCAALTPLLRGVAGRTFLAGVRSGEFDRP